MPLSPSVDVHREYPYVPPNEHYRELFRKATERAIPPNAHSAGWLVPDESTKCDPVFVAHSIQSAIRLLRQILPEYTLSNAAWDALARAAPSPTQHSEDADAPASAQRPHSPLPSASETPCAKRAKTVHLDDIDASDHQSPTSALSETDGLAEEPADHHNEEGEVPRTNVTNNNRLAGQRCGLKRKRSLGLIKPHKEAPAAEHSAYASIPPKDEPTVAWIIKQKAGDSTLYETAHNPYATAATMLQHACALGNQSALSYAATFLKSWRSLGAPFPTRAAPSSTPTTTSSALTKRMSLPWMASSSQCNTVDSDFRSAWNAVNFFEDQLAAVHIQYRWAMAFLARAYAEKVAELEREDETAGRGQGRGRHGKGNLRTQAKKALLSLVLPNAASKDYSIFKKRLQRATRWYEAADRLGWGSLCLMPHHQITNTWVEQTLRVGEWHIWLELVKKVNPDAYAASKAFESWLGSESIAGGPIEGKEPLRIEAEPLSSTCEVEEVNDSDDDDGSFAPTQSQAIPALEPPRPLRQLTLPELFKPQRQFSPSQSISAA
jgi:hypothetical protein